VLRCHRYWLIVQVLVDADAAKTLETLCRARRRRAAGEELAAVRPPESDPWPGEVVPLLQGHDCAIARTVPASNGLVEVREVERLYLDMIDAAERFFYIENQYLTSAAIRDVLAGRLRRRNGPEIVIILPRETGDWLEQRTMDVLRARLLRFLREAGRHRRLRVYYPSAPGLSERCCASPPGTIAIARPSPACAAGCSGCSSVSTRNPSRPPRIAKIASLRRSSPCAHRAGRWRPLPARRIPSGSASFPTIAWSIRTAH
jgi:hypothetical protein